MARLPPSRLMIEADDVRKTKKALPRLLHNIFYLFQITNEKFASLYAPYAKARWPNEPQNKYHPRLGAARGAVQNRDNVTFYMFETNMDVLRKDIVDITVKIRDRDTGEIDEVSVSDTVEKLDAMRNKSEDYGVSSL